MKFFFLFIVCGLQLFDRRLKRHKIAKTKPLILSTRNFSNNFIRFFFSLFLVVEKSVMWNSCVSFVLRNDDEVRKLSRFSSKTSLHCSTLFTFVRVNWFLNYAFCIRSTKIADCILSGILNMTHPFKRIYKYNYATLNGWQWPPIAIPIPITCSQDFVETANGAQ